MAAVTRIKVSRETLLAKLRKSRDGWAGNVEGWGPAGWDASYSLRERLAGLAFSILVALDGGAAVGPYAVRPILYADGPAGHQIGEGNSLTGDVELHQMFRALDPSPGGWWSR